MCPIAICSTLESLFLLALSFYLIIAHTSKTTSLYAGLSIYAVLCYCYFVIDSIWNENKFQFIAANVVSVLYTTFIAFEAFHRPNELGTHTCAKKELSLFDKIRKYDYLQERSGITYD